MAQDLEGTSGADTLRGSDIEMQRLMGKQGNDTLFIGRGGGAAFGGNGNDTIYGGGDGRAQSHIYGGNGNDTIYLNPVNSSAPHGEHVWGGEGHDRFIFTGIKAGETGKRIVGRIDDFDYSRDEIWIDDEKLDLFNLPAGVRIVSHNDQPWLLIDDHILYALEGARLKAGGGTGGEETHFIDWPAAWADGVPESANMSYEDLENFFPAHLVVTPEGGFANQFGKGANEMLHGTAGADYIRGGDGSDLIHGENGDDLLMGDEGHDIIHGGGGRDSISGGIDRDLIYGGSGADMIYGGAGEDTLHGDQGDDTLRGNHGNDLIFGGSGNDRLFGGLGNDTLVGGSGSDRLNGGDGNDLLIAGFADDDVVESLLNGGKGHDTLVGAAGGRSIMTGGHGRDFFVATADGEAIITDFAIGTDRLSLAGLLDPERKLADLMRVEEVDDRSDLIIDLIDGGSVRLQGIGGVAMKDLTGSLVLEGPAPDFSGVLDLADGLVPGHPDHAGAAGQLYGQAEGPGNGDHGGHEGHGPGGNDEEDGDEEEPGNEPAAGKSDGTCFVATAAYGGANHPEVAALRRLRDEVLVTHPLGRAFIAFYWRVGPHLAARVHTEGHAAALVRRIVRLILR